MKAILSLLTLFISLSLFAQKDQIENTFNNYIEATHAVNVGDQLDYFYPQMFEYFPREKMLEGLTKTRENGKISLENERLVSISEVLTEGGKKFALLTYQVDLNLNVAELKGQEGADEAIANMTKDYVEQHGEENVSFDGENYVFTITFTNTLYAILDKKLGSWKFLPKDETSTMITEQVIPEGIRARL
ncbi:MAG: hypothetical protein CMP59_03125 [Flavobacteriales bacterium]|nr:hypothetical protein [Flavobacteriales bacterium]